MHVAALCRPGRTIARDIQMSGSCPMPVKFFHRPPNELEESAGIVVKADDSSNWVKVHDDKVYTPTAADIGFRLRIDITAFAVADNSVIAGPIALYTEPVLAAPRKSAFKRILQPIPHERTAISGSVRFRIVSYNVLAEKYATKQVCSLTIGHKSCLKVERWFLHRHTLTVIHGIFNGHSVARFCLKNWKKFKVISSVYKKFKLIIMNQTLVRS